MLKRKNAVPERPERRGKRYGSTVETAAPGASSAAEAPAAAAAAKAPAATEAPSAAAAAKASATAEAAPSAAASETAATRGKAAAKAAKTRREKPLPSFITALLSVLNAKAGAPGWERRPVNAAFIR